jgi:hypothetical protein
MARASVIRRYVRLGIEDRCQASLEAPYPGELHNSYSRCLVVASECYLDQSISTFCFVCDRRNAAEVYFGA